MPLRCLVTDLNKLHSLLRATAHDMTRWDVYVAEVDSGHLQWGMVHTEKFFQENAQMMEGPNGDFVLVKVCTDDEHVFDSSSQTHYSLIRRSRFHSASLSWQPAITTMLPPSHATISESLLAFTPMEGRSPSDWECGA
jgi:hypothetical protein